MTAILMLLVLAAGFGSLTHYARRDRFAGAGVRFCPRDDLGCAARARLVS